MVHSRASAHWLETMPMADDYDVLLEFCREQPKKRIKRERRHRIIGSNT
jgi:hypothetical protein